MSTGYLALSTYTGGDTTSLYIINPETCLVTNAGNFGPHVWPAVSLYQFDCPTDLTVYLDPLPKLFEGTSATAHVEVILYEDNPSVTWATSDTSVATVDENGVGAGTATITACHCRSLGSDSRAK